MYVTCTCCDSGGCTGQANTVAIFSCDCYGVVLSTVQVWERAGCICVGTCSVVRPGAHGMNSVTAGTPCWIPGYSDDGRLAVCCRHNVGGNTGSWERQECVLGKPHIHKHGQKKYIISWSIIAKGMWRPLNRNICWRVWTHNKLFLYHVFGGEFSELLYYQFFISCISLILY